MSNYTFKAKNKTTGEIADFLAMDDYYGKHEYGYRLTGYENDISNMTYAEPEFNELFERVDEPMMPIIQSQKEEMVRKIEILKQNAIAYPMVIYPMVNRHGRMEDYNTGFIKAITDCLDIIRDNEK